MIFAFFGHLDVVRKHSPPRFALPSGSFEGFNANLGVSEKFGF